MVGQCLVLVLRGEPAPLQLPRSYLAADAMVCVGRCCRRGRVRCCCSCNGAATAAWHRRAAVSTTGQGGGGGRGDTVLRSCLQHCKAAPQPRETGQKKRKCRSGSDGARDGTRGASEIPFVRMGRDRTERERRSGARCKERTRGEREEGSVYSDTSHCHCCAWQKRNA